MNLKKGMVKTFLRRIPLRAQTILLIGIIILISCGTVAVTVYNKGVQSLDEEVNKDGRHQADLIRNLSLDALIAEDRPALQTIIGGIIKLDLGMMSIEIKNYEGANLVSWTAAAGLNTRVVETKQPIEYKGQNFGTLQLRWDRSHFEEPIMKRAKDMTKVALIALIFLGVSIFIFVEIYFIQPINYLERKVSAFRVNGFENIESKDFSAGEIQKLDRNIEDGVIALQEQVKQDILLRDQRQKVKTAEAATEAKSEFLSLMSHEIRTPLGAILGFTELLDSPSLEEENRMHVAQIRESGKFLLNIINDILDLSRIEADGLPLEKNSFSIEKLIGDTKAMISGLAATKGIDLRFDIKNPDSHLVIGDAHRIQQVIMNLAGNAIKFTDSGTVKVSVDVSPGEATAAHVRFSVKDSGIGMTPEQAVSIFTPFSQADDSITRKYGGTGLGVPISAKLINGMGGVLNVDTEIDQGSEFYFSIELPIDSESKANNGAEVEHSPDLSPANKTGRFLFAEDNIVNQSLFSQLLDKYGYDYVIVGNGQECIDCLKVDKNFDAVILDVHMPILDGLEVLKMIRDGEVGEGLKSVTIASMTADVLSRGEAMTLGADEFIMKPICFDQLKFFLNSVIDKKEANTRTESGEFSIASSDWLEPGIGFINDQISDKKLRIMVADDNEAMRNLLEKIIVRFGHTASFTEDGVNCLNALALSEYDVLVSDFRMPNMDGKTLIGKIRNGDVGEFNRNMPIALITAEKITDAESAAAKADLLIPKPIAMNSLKKFLDDAERSIELVG